MSIWTNSALLGVLGFTLGACADMNFGQTNRSITVLGGDIVVAPPAGYCSDPSVSTSGNDTAVVLMGKCSASSAAVPALITASIGAKGSGAAVDVGPVALTSFFTSDQGRAMLASTGKTKDAVVSASEVQEDALLLLVKDAAAGSYWRAILALKGRLVMLSANGVETMTLAPNDGRALLSGALISLRRANGAAGGGGLFSAPAPAPATAAAPAPAGDAAPQEPSAAAPASGKRPAPRPRVPTSG